MADQAIVTELQSLGARIEVPIKERGRRGGAGPSDGKPFVIGEVATTVPTLGEFAEKSPYAVVESEDGYQLTRNGRRLMPVRFPPTPCFYDLTTADGIPYRQIALMHGVDTLATTVFQKCVHWHRPGERCQFCAIELSLERGATIVMKTPEQLAEVAEAAGRLDGASHFILTTGTINLKDKGVRYLARCAQAIKASTSIGIQAQFEPPDDLEDMVLLRDAGVESVGLHLESFDQSVRERVAPGKAKIGIERYFEAYRRAVELFGRNQVSSYIIVGLGEGPESIVEGCRSLAKIGVYPFVVPLRPIIGTLMQDARTPSPELMASIYTQVAAINREQGLSWRNSKAGCERCGACSALPAYEG
ncbi:MAG TPA: MSMEG_0568 family radical SAM protein [Chloroflexota bacterium]|nr:MSMEG_0568 family radical SAM protein [Chloroflexota bacterium]